MNDPSTMNPLERFSELASNGNDIRVNETLLRLSSHLRRKQVSSTILLTDLEGVTMKRQIDV